MVDETDYRQILEKIQKFRNVFKLGTEFKWTNISKSRINFYQAVIDLFMNEPGLGFRAVIVNKKHLNHKLFNDGDHNLFYYKMFYYVIDHFINTQDTYKVFFDYKDTKSKIRLSELKKVFDNKYRNNTDISFQNIRSHESQLIQLADIFIGAVSYKVRGLKTSEAKLNIVEYLEKKTGRNLIYSTSPFDKKFNLFFLQLQTGNEV